MHTSYFRPQAAPARLLDLIDRLNEGGSDEAKLIGYNHDGGTYVTELEDIGPMYLMDDFGNAVVISWELWRQNFGIFHTYVGALT